MEMIGLPALTNPYVLLGIGVTLAITHGAVGYKAYQLGGDHARVACDVRVNKLQGEYDAQAKRIAELNKQWQATIDAYLEQEAKRAQDAQAELDEANKRVDDYERELAINATKAACVLDQSDIDRLRKPTGQGGPN